MLFLEKLNSLSPDRYLMALSGWVIFNMVILIMSQSKYDENKDGVWSRRELGRYFTANFLNIFLSLFICIVWVYFGWTKDTFYAVMDVLGKDWKFREPWYIAVSGIGLAIQFIINKFKLPK